MHIYCDSSIRTKWAEKSIPAAGDLVGYPLDSRKTISQFHNAFSTYDSNIPMRCVMIVEYDPDSYE